MIHVFEFPATNDQGSDQAIVFIHLWTAFKLPPTLGGVRLADNNDDLLCANEAHDALEELLVNPTAPLPELRPEGGMFALSDNALALLKKCWSRTEQHGPVGLRAQLGTNVKIINKVETFLKELKQMTPDEYAEYKNPATPEPTTED